MSEHLIFESLISDQQIRFSVKKKSRAAASSNCLTTTVVLGLVVALFGETSNIRMSLLLAKSRNGLAETPEKKRIYRCYTE